MKLLPQKVLFATASISGSGQLQVYVTGATHIVPPIGYMVAVIGKLSGFGIIKCVPLAPVFRVPVTGEPP